MPLPEILDPPLLKGFNLSIFVVSTSDLASYLMFTGAITEHGMIIIIPRGKHFHKHEDSDWIDSPARSEFLYILPKS